MSKLNTNVPLTYGKDHIFSFLWKCLPVVHKEIACKGKQQQDDSEVQLELLIFVFVGKSGHEFSKCDKQKYPENEVSEMPLGALLTMPHNLIQKRSPLSGKKKRALTLTVC